jgi:drug/metabolite transporter (DMT)-like permease
MKWLSRVPLVGIVVLYMLAYVPYMVITKQLASTPAVALGRPLSGLEILPASLIVSGLLTFVFIGLSGWWRAAHQGRIGGLAAPVPTGWTFLSGVCTALVLFTVPLSLTFKGVSIPFIQLLMRGDVLLLAPLVDLVFRRKVGWYSWVALMLVALGLFLTIRQRGGLHLPPLAIATIVLYTIGYFGRLAVMTRVSKSGDPDSVRRYFVEEKIVAVPLSVAFLALVPLLGLGTQGSQLSWGFFGVWSTPQIGPILILSVLLFVVSVFAAIILLDPRENTFCVPMERSASIVAGIAASFILAAVWGLPTPTGAEVVGALLMIAAVVLLAVAPSWGRRRQAILAAAEEPS